jgi:hypothetical protein
VFAGPEAGRSRFTNPGRTALSDRNTTVEIADQIRRSGRRAWLIVALPVLAAAVALAVQLQRPQEYQSTATVLTPPAATQRTGGQYIGDFKAALASSPVAEATGQEVGLPPGEIKNGLAASTSAAGSTLIEVTWVGANRSAAERVPAVAAREAFELLVKPRQNALEAEEKMLTLQYEQAAQARDAYTKEIGVLLPPQEYQALVQETTQLRNNYQSARAEGRDGASALKVQLDARIKDRDALAPKVIQYNQLQSDVERAYAALASTRNELSEVRGQLESVDQAGTITTDQVRAVSSLLPLVRNVLGAAIVGFGVALLALVALATLFGQPRRAPATPPSGTPPPTLLGGTVEPHPGEPRHGSWVSAGQGAEYRGPSE